MVRISPDDERQIPDQDPQDTEWAELQEQLAADAGISLLLVEGHQPPALVVSNNNSICQAIQSSIAHAALCDPYCGEAHQRAISAQGATHFRCHAGLYCFVAPVQIGRRVNLAMIGGRAFLSAADYRNTLE